MRVILRASLVLAVAATVAVTPSFASRVHRAPTSGHSHAKRQAVPVAPKAKKTHGQQTIDSQRVTAIQQALIREHYLTAEPTAKWDSDTQAAMTKFQADQGWQTRLTPDSRALIKLGLGPDHSGAINASASANFNTLVSPSAIVPAPGFEAASGVSH